MRDYNNCKGCYKCVNDSCTTFPDCWMDKLKPYENHLESSTKISRREEQKLLFLTLYHQHLTDAQIAQRMGVKAQTVGRWRMSLGLPINKKVPPRFGNAVREYRVSMNLSRRQFAEKYGVTVKVVTNWELDETNTPDYLIADIEAHKKENHPTEPESLPNG